MKRGGGGLENQGSLSDWLDLGDMESWVDRHGPGQVEPHCHRIDKPFYDKRAIEPNPNQPGSLFGQRDRVVYLAEAVNNREDGCVAGRWGCRTCDMSRDVGPRAIRYSDGLQETSLGA